MGSSHQSHPHQELQQQSKFSQSQQQRQSARATNSMTPDSLLQDEKTSKNDDKNTEFESKDSSPLTQVESDSSTQPQLQQPLQQHELNEQQTSPAAQPKHPSHPRRPRSKALQRRRRQMQGDSLHSDGRAQMSGNSPTQHHIQQKQPQADVMTSDKETERKDPNHIKSEEGPTGQGILESNVTSKSKW